MPRVRSEVGGDDQPARTHAVSEIPKDPAHKTPAIHPLALIAWLAIATAVWKFGRYRPELLAGVLVYFALAALSNFVYLLYGRRLGLPAEEVSFGLAGGFGGFRVGRTLVRFGWLPVGGYVKFPGQDADQEAAPIALRAGERTYHQVHPLARVPFVLSAPLITVALGLGMLWAAGAADLPAVIFKSVAETPVPGPLSVSRRAAEAWLQSFSGPAGLPRGAAITFAFFGGLNLFPAPGFAGGIALAHVIEWLTSRPSAGKRLNAFTMLLFLAPLAVLFLWWVGVVLAVFGGSDGG